MLEPDADRLVWFLAQMLAARNIVEIGTSRGVSTLWLADAARSTGGHVLTLDVDSEAPRTRPGRACARPVSPSR